MAQGTAKTTNFMLGTCTVMIGPMADLKKLNPTEHSIGLVKNFQIGSDPQYTELTQGVKNQIVFSAMTRNDVRATMEVFEFTPQNLAYGLGLTGTYAALTDTSAVAANVTANATTFTVTTGHGVKFSIGDYVMIKKDLLETYIVRKITAISTDTLTVDVALPAITAGAVVEQVHKIGGGSKTEQDYYSALITGTYADGKSVALEIPKFRITKGFSFGFNSSDFGNLPFEFTIYDLVSTDTYYTDFGGESFRIFSA